MFGNEHAAIHYYTPVQTNGSSVCLQGSGSPEEHGDYVWERLVKQSSAWNIAIVAHSYGGVVATRLLEKYFDDFKQRVFAIALTDSVHHMSYSHKHIRQFFKKVCSDISVCRCRCVLE